MSPSNRVAQLYYQTLGSLFIASYDSQGYGGGILTLLHTTPSVSYDVSEYSYIVLVIFMKLKFFWINISLEFDLCPEYAIAFHTHPQTKCCISHLKLLQAQSLD
jgi:hypothetical protein